MQDNINIIISNSLKADKENLSENIKNIIMQIKKTFEVNKELIIQTNQIDLKNNNGFIMDFNIINRIFSNLEKETIIYGDVTLSQKDDEKKIIYGKQIMDYGNVVVINDGNPYVIIEMLIRNIMAGNTTIFSNNGYMFGTNQLLIQLVQSVLEQFNISKYLVQIYISETYNELLSNYANIDLVVCIGDHNLQTLIAKKSSSKTIFSGYENFDLYIEDSTHIDFLNQIVNLDLNIQVYINKDVEIDYPNTIIVDDIDEAIAQINYNGSGYSTAIFTDNKENASKFIREIKSKKITVNTSPTIERIMDINQMDLTREKIIIYPLSYKFDGKSFNIDVIKE